MSASHATPTAISLPRVPRPRSARRPRAVLRSIRAACGCRPPVSRHGLTSFLLWALALSLGVCPARGLHASTELAALPDSGFVNVKTAFGAAGDGVTDDTAALKRLAKESHRRNLRRFYLPPGEYLVTDTIGFIKRTHVIGAGPDKTVIRLAPRSPGFDNPERPKAVLASWKLWRDGMQGGMANNFNVSVQNLAIEVGPGNPGAVGLHFFTHNWGRATNLRIASLDPDGRGFAGLAWYFAWPGPGLVRDIEIDGFDRGIWSGSSQYSMTLDRIALSNQRVVGIENEQQMLAIHKLSSDNAVPAIRTTAGGVITLLDSELRGRDVSGPAIVPSDPQGDGRGMLLLRGVKVSGYNAATGDWPRNAAAGEVDFFCWPDALTLGGGDGRPLNLPVEEAPDVPYGDPEAWVNVRDFGAEPTAKVDSTRAIRRALSSGAHTIYLPYDHDLGKTYRISAPLEVPGHVRRIIGAHVNVRGGEAYNGPQWRIRGEQRDGPLVFEAVGTGRIRHDSTRTLILRYSAIYDYRNTVPGGKVFIEDVAGSQWHFTGQRVWARQHNPETREQFNLRAEDSQLWYLGLKTEGPKTVIEAADSDIELFGGFLYPNRGAEEGAAAFDLKGSRLFANYVDFMGGSYAPQARLRHDGVDASELFMHVDFTDREHPMMIYRIVERGDTLTNRRIPRDRVDYYRSYGNRVSALSVE